MIWSAKHASYWYPKSIDPGTSLRSHFALATTPINSSSMKNNLRSRPLNCPEACVDSVFQHNINTLWEWVKHRFRHTPVAGLIPRYAKGLNPAGKMVHPPGPQRKEYHGPEYLRNYEPWSKFPVRYQNVPQILKKYGPLAKHPLHLSPHRSAQSVETQVTEP